MKKLTFIFILVSFFSKAANPSSIIFKENKGQWPHKVLFGAEFLNTKFYINKNSFSYCVYNYTDLKAAGEYFHSLGKFLPRQDSVLNLPSVGNIRGHNYEVVFVNSDLSKVTRSKEQPDYYNYFLGNNRNKWASNIKAYGNLEFTDIYEGINLKVYSNGSDFKYDLVLNPGSNVNTIKLHYKYIDGVEILNNELHVKTSVGEIIEKEAFAYQFINGKQKQVKCKYTLLGDNSVGFIFPEGYDTKHELVIDPTVVVCSYSGHTTHGWGSACGYDSNGNIYSAGGAGINYPITTGAFQQTYKGWFDIALSVYNATGTSKIFSSYLGGDSIDLVESIKVVNNEIVMGGATLSDNFPCTINAYDSTFNGKTDLFVAKVNLSGTSLIASTYIGGEKEDGGWWLYSPAVVGYESFRNIEIVIDSSKNVFLASVSNSTSFPVTSGAISTTLTGNMDGVVLKLDPTLNNLVWSTFLGGNRDDVVKGIRLDGSGSIYCMGSTTSSTFPTTSGVISPTKPGAIFSSEMFVAVLNTANGSLIRSTYLGTTGYDYGSLLSLDQNNDVYICGHIQSPSLLVPTAGLYNNPSGFNTIYKINSALTAINFKTKFGFPNPPVNPPQSPYLLYSAFLVDSCQNIYLAGAAENFMPTTSNQLQAFAGGITDFYFALFSANCASLKFASFFGGAKANYGIGEHCDYAHAAFDNKGRLYQGMCTNGGAPVTPNAYCQTFAGSGDTLYNDGFLKIDFQSFVNAGSSYGAAITGCPPFTPTFVSTTNLGSTYWNFGDGNSSTIDTVSHTYTDLGTYNVLLVVTDTSTCNKYDSIKSVLSVINPTPFDIGEDIKTCLGVPVLVRSNVTAVTYSWSSGQTVPNIMALPGTYTLTINNGGCNSSDEINVVLGEPKLSERFPNVVTANGDGVNDFIDLDKYNFAEVELYIYDRWGRELDKINDPVAHWSPDNLSDGTYYYVVNYKSSCTGKHNVEKGFITVFR